MKFGILAVMAVLMATAAQAVEPGLEVVPTESPSFLGLDSSNDLDLKFDFETTGSTDTNAELYNFVEQKADAETEARAETKIEEKVVTDPEAKTKIDVEAKTSADLPVVVKPETSTPAEKPTKE